VSAFDRNFLGLAAPVTQGVCTGVYRLAAVIVIIVIAPTISNAP